MGNYYAGKIITIYSVLKALGRRTVLDDGRAKTAVGLTKRHLRMIHV